MKLLALESSTESCSVALWLDGEVRALDALPGERNSQVLLPMVDGLLAAVHVKLGALDAVAFGMGPGSFTGLRVACGVAQGLAFGAGLPVVGVGTLMAMAEATRAERVVCCLDARMSEIYHAAYEKHEGTWRALVTPSLCKPDLAPELPAGNWTACGNAFSAYGGQLVARYRGRLAEILPEVLPNARQIAKLAVSELALGNGVSAERAEPYYLRDKVALRVDER